MGTSGSDLGRESVAVVSLDRGDGRAALAELSALDREGVLTPAGREALARACWLCGDIDGCISAYERAFREHLDRDDRVRAGFVAVMLAWEHSALAASARSEGWLARAQRLLADSPESVEHGYLSWFQGRKHLVRGEIALASEVFERALEVAGRRGDANLEALARWYGGFALIQEGELDDGFGLIDEAMAAASGGELSAFIAGFVYCITITACRELGDYRRAGEWTEAQRRWCEQVKDAVYPSACRVNRASVLGMRGAWDDAEAEASSACMELEQLGALGGLAEALCELGGLRLRRGDLAGAEEAIVRANGLGVNPGPVLAQLRLAQGRPGEARALVEHALSGQAPPAKAVRLLPLLAEALVAEGDLLAARAAVARLEEAETRRAALPFGEAAAGSAIGRLQLAEGDAAGAVETLTAAVRLWQEVVQAPYETARTRCLLAEAHSAAGNSAAATVEAQAALGTFERLGAQLDADTAQALLHRLAPAGGGATHLQRCFLFTDIVGSTQLIEAIGDDAWHELVSWHDATLRSLFAAHDGEEVNHAGDGFFVAFPDPTTAVACAVAIQQTLADHRRQTGFAPKIRVGIHSDEATGTQGSYRGRGVHIAARIASHAEADEILVSRATADTLPPTHRINDRGELALKGIANPVSVVALDWTAP